MLSFFGYAPSHVILKNNYCNGSLLLGDYGAAIDSASLNQQNVKAMITAAAGLYINPKGICHLTLSALDTESYQISKHFDECYKFIDDNLKTGNFETGNIIFFEGSVLVHCAAGVSRSASIVISYLMKKFQWSFEVDAVQFAQMLGSLDN